MRNYHASTKNAVFLGPFYNKQLVRPAFIIIFTIHIKTDQYLICDGYTSRN